MATDRRQSEKETIKGFFHEFPSAHALLDITCKIAVSPQRSDAFSSCCKGTCMSTRSTYLRGQQNGKPTTNRVFVNITRTCKSRSNLTIMRSCRFVFDELVEQDELYERDGQLAKRSTNRELFVNLHLLVNPL